MPLDFNQFDTFNVFGKSYQLPLDETEPDTREKILLVATMYFAARGFAAVSMRDIAKVLGIQSSSLYNHYKSKEDLWLEVLRHTSELYALYFNHLSDMIDKAKSFPEILDITFREPKMMSNTFTCYAFCMIRAEQFRDESAGKVFREQFLDESIEFFRKKFDKCVADGMVKPFDTGIVATIIMHSVFSGLELSLQKRLGYHTLFEPAEMFANLERFLLTTICPEQYPKE